MDFRELLSVIRSAPLNIRLDRAAQLLKEHPEVVEIVLPRMQGDIQVWQEAGTRGVPVVDRGGRETVVWNEAGGFKIEGGNRQPYSVTPEFAMGMYLTAEIDAENHSSVDRENYSYGDERED
ncbi:MAG: hypothetical protein Q7S31_02310 [bacterium]|nr:hypothetical protein [bacterium]